MTKKLTVLLLIVYFLKFNAHAQCNTPGQTAATAFPVCGTATFAQSSVAICQTGIIPTPCQSNVTFTDKNPYWYRFTCFQSGSLQFTIAPNVSSDDYDWQLFDVTGRQASDVFSDPSLFVACNWSGEPGNTGTSPLGNSLVECEGPGVPTLSAMPSLIAGHTYLLLVSHFTDSQSGYSLTFSGGSSIITDPATPGILKASAPCDGTVVDVKLKKKMKCNSLATDGSDFSISPPIASIISASGINCSNSFDFDSLRLQLSTPLPPGTYILKAKTGTDNNTIIDNCNNGINIGDSAVFILFPVVPTPFDSIIPPACAPDSVILHFRKKIRCNSIAANGSDFSISGPGAPSIISATGNCNNSGVTETITLQLSAPIFNAGSYTITLQNGLDGNTIIDECGEVTPPASVNFVTADTVNADFSYNIFLGCDNDTIQYYHNGANGVNNWLWLFDSLRLSNVQNPRIFYARFGLKNTQLIVSNGTCRDTASANILLDNYLQAGFTMPKVVCPNEQVQFTDTSIGNIIHWQWNFGNGNTGISQAPPLQYYNAPNRAEEKIPVQLIVTNTIGCKDTTVQQLLLASNCYIAVPTAFTPNGDGLNDYLYPLNAYKATGLLFEIYNRFGKKIFTTGNWLQPWDGKYKSVPADAGTYVWILKYINEWGVPVSQKGVTVLIR